MILSRRRAEARSRARALRLRLLSELAEAERCLVCGTDLDDGFRCCPGCGLSLRTDCDRCGETIHVAWSACPYCADGSRPHLTLTASDGAA